VISRLSPPPVKPVVPKIQTSRLKLLEQAVILLQIAGMSGGKYTVYFQTFFRSVHKNEFGFRWWRI
jgi:hypothetical protein